MKRRQPSAAFPKLSTEEARRKVFNSHSMTAGQNKQNRFNPHAHGQPLPAYQYNQDSSINQLNMLPQIHPDAYSQGYQPCYNQPSQTWATQRDLYQPNKRLHLMGPGGDYNQNDSQQQQNQMFQPNMSMSRTADNFMVMNSRNSFGMVNNNNMLTYQGTNNEDMNRNVMCGMPFEKEVENEKKVLYKKEKTPDFEIKKKEQIDFSMHFITASIQGAKHWVKQLSKVPLMVEIFGVLNSAITGGNDGYSCSKEFILRDDKDTIRCVFYQIDHSLPKMIRGSWYRCVGHVSQSNNLFLNCLRIRNASDQEKKMYKTQISVSDKAMRNLVSKMKES